MKKTFKVFALSLVAVSTLFACSKEMDVLNDKPVVEGNKTIITIKATNPESVATKTTMSGTTPSWLAGDQITVIYKNTSDAVATAESTPLAGAITTATFDATLVDANTSINGYAVYPANNLAQTLSVAKIPIAAEQHPTGTAFDGASDIMVSEAFTPAGTVSTRFARLGAILRVKVSNATLNDEKILSLSVTAENELVGNANVNLSNASLSGLTGGSSTVTATYEPANQFTVGAADKYVYLIVYPQELTAGSTLTISGETENTTFSRDIILPNKIVLNPGHIIPLNVTISSFTVKEKVFFEERFSEGAGTTGFTGTVAAASFVADNDGWEADNKYCGEGCARFGKSKTAGIATTPSIIIPKVYWDQDIKVSFKAGAWRNAGTELGLSADGATITSSVDIESEDWSEHVVSLTSVTKSPITITFTPDERFLLDDVCVYYGTKPIERPSPGLAFSSSTAQAYLGETASFTEPTLTNEHGVVVTYESDDTDIAEVASDGQVTLKEAGTANISAVFAGNASYRAQTVSYALTVKTPTLSISPSGNILLGGAANSVKSITITATHAWTATLNATATSARGTSFSVLNSSDSVIDGAITGTTGVTTIKFKALGDGDPSDVSSYGTITFTDNLYAGATSGAIDIKQSANVSDPVLFKTFTASGIGSGYGVHTGVSSDEMNWTITFGQGTYIGTNSSNKSKCKLGSTYEKVGTPCGYNQNTTQVAAIISESTLADIRQVIVDSDTDSYNPEKISLVYSTDNTTYSLIETQNYSKSLGNTFSFSKKDAGYYAIVLYYSSSSYMRTNGLKVKFYQ